MWDLFGNPEDPFSHNEAQFIAVAIRYCFKMFQVYLMFCLPVIYIMINGCYVLITSYCVESLCLFVFCSFKVY